MRNKKYLGNSSLEKRLCVENSWEMIPHNGLMLNPKACLLLNTRFHITGMEYGCLLLPKMRYVEIYWLLHNDIIPNHHIVDNAE